jgi:hypothetical protein
MDAGHGFARAAVRDDAGEALGTAVERDELGARAIINRAVHSPGFYHRNTTLDRALARSTRQRMTAQCV